MAVWVRWGQTTVTKVLIIKHREKTTTKEINFEILPKFSCLTRVKPTRWLEVSRYLDDTSVIRWTWPTCVMASFHICVVRRWNQVEYVNTCKMASLMLPKQLTHTFQHLCTDMRCPWRQFFFLSDILKFLYVFVYCVYCALRTRDKFTLCYRLSKNSLSNKDIFCFNATKCTLLQNCRSLWTPTVHQFLRQRGAAPLPPSSHNHRHLKQGALNAAIMGNICWLNHRLCREMLKRRWRVAVKVLSSTCGRFIDETRAVPLCRWCFPAHVSVMDCMMSLRQLCCHAWRLNEDVTW